MPVGSAVTTNFAGVLSDAAASVLIQAGCEAIRKVLGAFAVTCTSLGASGTPGCWVNVRVAGVAVITRPVDLYLTSIVAVFPVSSEVTTIDPEYEPPGVAGFTVTFAYRGVIADKGSTLNHTPSEIAASLTSSRVPCVLPILTNSEFTGSPAVPAKLTADGKVT